MKLFTYPDPQQTSPRGLILYILFHLSLYHAIRTRGQVFPQYKQPVD